jgi:hypothetical protein
MAQLSHFYYGIEDGLVELDDILRERTAALKSQRERVRAALDRARALCATATTINAEKIVAFTRLMTDRLDTGETNARAISV